MFAESLKDLVYGLEEGEQTTFFKANCTFISIIQGLKSKHKLCMPHTDAVRVWYLV